MAKLTEAERSALILLQNEEGALSTDDVRCDQFSDDGDPDTWNQLFEKGLAEQSGPGFAGDDFSIRITAAGRTALASDPSQGRKRP